MGGLSLSDAWREMEALRGEGKAKSIGVSNYIAVSQLEETLKHAEVSHRRRQPLSNRTQLVPSL